VVPITLHKQRCHAVGTRAYDIPGLHSCQGHGDITAFHGGNFLGHLSEAGCYRVMPTGCNKTMHETLLDISSLKSTVNHRGGQHKCGGVCGCLMTNRTKPKPFRSTHRACKTMVCPSDNVCCSDIVPLTPVKFILGAVVVLAFKGGEFKVTE
jgi:hypothetical protein